MNLQRTCNYIYENDRRCGKTYGIHEFYFRDPYHNSNCFVIHLCKWHTEEIIQQTTYRVKDFQMKLSNLISENARLKKIARDYDTYTNNAAIEQKIQDLKELIKRIQNNECKNFFCNKSLRELEQKEKIFSVHVFKPSGRRWYSFYYCSLACFNTMKGRCGMISLFCQGQTTL